MTRANPRHNGRIFIFEWHVCTIMRTFIEADLVSQYDHAFCEQLILEVLCKEGAQLSLQ